MLLLMFYFNLIYTIFHECILINLLLSQKMLRECYILKDVHSEDFVNKNILKLSLNSYLIYC